MAQKPSVTKGTLLKASSVASLLLRFIVHIAGWLRREPIRMRSRSGSRQDFSMPSLLPPRSSYAFRSPLGLLAGLGVVAGLFFLCFKVWSEVAEGDARGFDQKLLLSLRVSGHPDVPIGPAWLTQSMIDISGLGGGTLLTLLIVAACGYLVIKRARTRAALLATATISGATLLFLLKNIFGRPRPEFIDHLVTVQSMSFPSGHAANSALVYLTIAALASDVEPSFRVRIYIMTVAMILTVLIGFSRLYLGVHWPSDVLAGWALGAGWALAWRLAASRLPFDSRV